MVGQGVQPRGGTHDAGRHADGVRDEEENADDLFEPGPTDNVRHVCDRVAPCVVVPEVALHDGAVGVQGLPAQDVDGAGEGAEGV